VLADNPKHVLGVDEHPPADRNFRGQSRISRWAVARFTPISSAIPLQSMSSGRFRDDSRWLDCTAAFPATPGLDPALRVLEVHNSRPPRSACESVTFSLFANSSSVRFSSSVSQTVTSRIGLLAPVVLGLLRVIHPLPFQSACTDLWNPRRTDSLIEPARPHADTHCNAHDELKCSLSADAASRIAMQCDAQRFAMRQARNTRVASAARSPRRRRGSFV
jgi:hypothetical protein